MAGVTVSYRGRDALFDPATLAYGAAGAPLPLASAPLAPAAIDPTFNGRRFLERLVVNIANTCNLACGYCYAQGGHYGRAEQRMTASTGEETLDRFFRDYDDIASIQFFGGEPLLNLPLLERLCEHAVALAELRAARRPTLTVVTNGTLVNDKVIGLINRHQIQVTVSLDGPASVNDLTRPSRSGQPATQTVLRNLQRLRAETGQPRSVEGTFTRIHLQQGVTVQEVLDFAHQEVGVQRVHLPLNVARGAEADASSLREADIDEALDQYADAAARLVRDLTFQPVDRVVALQSAYGLLTSVKFPQAPSDRMICPAGSGTLAVDVDGSIYPCFMFYGQDDYRFGGGDAALSVIESRREAFHRPLLASNQPQLSRSWASGLISGCAGANQIKNDRHDLLDETDVRLTERMLAAIVVELAALRATPTHDQFLGHAMKIFETYDSIPPI
jgi:uncharacterized protein